MNISQEYLERCAAETGFQIGPLEKVARLGEMASHLARHPILGESLILKGGTALNLCFGTPKRLSVDLDFNYISHVDREKMLKDRPLIDDAATELSRRLGYLVQRSADAFAGRKLFLSYRSVLQQNERIEIDINYLFRTPISDIERHELWQPGALDRPKIRIVGITELVIGKLLAFLDRGAVRDIWDVANFSPRISKLLKSGIFRARFIALSAILEHPLPTYSLKRLKLHFDESSVDQLLLPLIIGESSIKLKKIADRAWEVVEPLLILKPDEKDYLTSIENGEIRPEKLFPKNPKEARKFASHPAILWKVANVRAHLTKKSRGHRNL